MVTATAEKRNRADIPAKAARKTNDVTTLVSLLFCCPDEIPALRRCI